MTFLTKSPFIKILLFLYTGLTHNLILLSCKMISIQTFSMSVLFLSGPSSIECLPETKEAGGSYTGVGGTLTGVLSVCGESCGFEKDNERHLIIVSQCSYTGLFFCTSLCDLNFSV